MGPLRFHGKVFSGLGRGAYYVAHPAFMPKFVRLLGYEPFPGTLNLRLSSPAEIEARRFLGEEKGYSIPASKFDGQEFSSTKCFPGMMGGIEVVLTIPQITAYDRTVLEIMARVKLRDALGLADGQVVELDVMKDLLLFADGH
jgi:riboflavin kinase